MFLIQCYLLVHTDSGVGLRKVHLVSTVKVVRTSARLKIRRAASFGFNG